MKSFLISENKDTWVGMRLAGINGVIIHNRDEMLAAVKYALEDEETGIIILTERAVDMAKDEIMELKLKCKKTLIIEIPDRKGTTREQNMITSYIRDSVGINI